MWYAELLTKSTLGAIAAFIFAGLDAFVAHRFTTDQELVIFGLGLTAMGIGGAFSAGVRVPTPSPAPPAGP